MAKKEKTVYCCRECGYETANWAWKCPSCGAWNSLAEFKPETASASKGGRERLARVKPKSVTSLDMSEEIRIPTGISELDRVLGGGAVIGSLVLVGGAPGIGKSTLLL